jgi:hypothetical protein
VPTSAKCGVYNEELAVKIMINCASLELFMVGETPSTPQPPKLLDQVRDRPRMNYYSIRTETLYL